VLPLLRDELQIALSPGQLAMVRLEHSLSMRGLIPCAKSKHTADFDPAINGETPWEVALQVLDTELSRLKAQKAVAKVILSNHFMRYTMMPWSDTLSDVTEEEAYARHCFRQLYGSDAEHWELRLSPQRAGLPQLACAVDARFLTAMRDVFKRNAVMLKSVQPRLMAAYNNSRKSLQNSSAWLVLYEPGNLCLAMLQQGYFSSIRTFRSGNNWRDTLLLALEREAFMAEENDKTGNVFLWAPELEDSELEEIVLSQGNRWKIRLLRPLLHPALAPHYEGRFAMALSC